MYITENQSLGESVLFMISARNSLAEMVEDSGHENSNTMMQFLINEASDYEIMSLLVEGVIPKEKYNDVNEAVLFSVLKEQVLANTSNISEMIGQQSFSDFMTKVDSVYPHVSTAGPMLEFFAATEPAIAGAMLISERPRFADAAAKKAEAVKGGSDVAGLKKAVAGAKAKAGTSPGEGGPEMAGGMKSFAGGQVAPTGKGAAADASMKKDLYARGPGGKEGFDVPNVDPSQTTLGAKLSMLKGDVQLTAAKVGAKLSSFAKTPEGLAVGGAALAALLAYAAAKTYKRFFSKAAGACRGMSGPAKTDCMGKFRGRALMAQAGDLQRGMASCGKSKNPAACKSAVGGKIERLKAKARKSGG